VSQKSNIIEINGKRYDALSGKLLGDSGAASTLKPASARSSGGGSMDGFLSKKPAAPAMTAQPAAPIAPIASVPAAPIMTKQFSDIVRRAPASHVKPHKTVPSKTLMRHAVTKPAPSLKRHTKVQQRTDVLVKQPSITVKPKMSSYQLDPKRVQRAKQTLKHPEANRYAIPRPVLAAAVTAAPAMATAAPRAVATMPAAQPAASKQATPTKAADIFEQALARANNHIEKPLARRHTKRRRGFFGGRALSIGSAAFAVLLLVGFFAWQQKADLTMRYAASRSGVAASLPGYQPAGFSTGAFTYSPGIVAVNFRNNASGDSFALIEKSSTWDSQALLDSFVAAKSRTYQTIDAAGRTIYTYGNNNATWIDNGIWYQVNSKGSLSTNQLVQLALSM
jgi:hypothetical protein